MQLWFSCDVDTGEPPRVEGVRRVWMWQDQEPPYGVDLVLPTYVKGRKLPKRLGLALVCPGYQRPEAGITCRTCRFCLPES